MLAGRDTERVRYEVLGTRYWVRGTGYEVLGSTYNDWSRERGVPALLGDASATKGVSSFSSQAESKGNCPTQRQLPYAGNSPTQAKGRLEWGTPMPN